MCNSNLKTPEISKGGWNLVLNEWYKQVKYYELIIREGHRMIREGCFKEKGPELQTLKRDFKHYLL